MYDQLSKTDLRKMQEEIEHRKVVLRHELLEDVKEARSHGDLSENFEYYAAKKAKNQNESRIRYLERMIRTATVVEDGSREDEVGLNTKVELLLVAEGVVETYRLVTTVRGNPLEGLISIESPLGKALLGRKVHDRVAVFVNDQVSYEVIIQKMEKGLDEELDQIRQF